MDTVGAGVVIWRVSHRADPRAVEIADRHYNRQKPGTAQFVPPGRCLVLLAVSGVALWVTSWPYAEWVRHRWPGRAEFIRGVAKEVGIHLFGER